MEPSAAQPKCVVRSRLKSRLSIKMTVGNNAAEDEDLEAECPPLLLQLLPLLQSPQVARVAEVAIRLMALRSCSGGGFSQLADFAHRSHHVTHGLSRTPYPFCTFLLSEGAGRRFAS